MLAAAGLFCLVAVGAAWAQRPIDRASARVPVGGERVPSPVVDAVITVHTERAPVNRFDPRATFGGGLDGHGKGAVADVFTPANIAAMKTTGLTMATVRLRTELGVRAWHWNPQGRWSDASHHQGYWTSNDRAPAPILLTHGYRLPRRGTTDENDDSAFSRLDDGDTASFWKSNPYLAQRFTGTADSLLPQWVIVDLGRPVAVNAMRIHWGAPHAAAFRVQYWHGEEVHDIDENPPGRWITFPNGSEPHGHGGVETRALSDSTVLARFVRLVLTASAHNAPAGATDPRDSLGYAIRELEIGVRANGVLLDAVRHGSISSRQSTTYTSSTDSWHRATDIDTDLEQPGFDRVFRSSLTFDRPAMVPVPVLYGTPEDAAAEVRFLRQRGYPIGRIEMGEEPDGQYVTPEDYAALYAQVARAIRTSWPNAPLGGPGFQGLESRVMFAWPSDTTGETWIPRFLAALRQRGRPGDFTFFSFEWYPWDDICGPAAPQLAAASARLADRLGQVERDGIPPSVPWVIAEYGYSAFAGQSQVELSGALLNADIVGRFLMLGGRAAYLYGWEPTSLDKSPRCEAWGNNMLFLADDRRRIQARVATYHGLQLLTQQWTSPRGGVHAMFAAESSVRDAEENELLSAYVLRLPDGSWSALLVNKDPSRSYRVTFKTGANAGGLVSEPRTVRSFSAAQYEWKADGANGHPVRSDSPTRQMLGTNDDLVVPPYSLTVVRTRHANAERRGTQDR